MAGRINGMAKRKTIKDDIPWREAIVQIIESRPQHVWSVSEICAEVAALPLIKARHIELSYGQPNYRHAVRSHLAKLVRDNCIGYRKRDQYFSATAKRV
jgi:hypothetical protein